MSATQTTYRPSRRSIRRFLGGAFALFLLAWPTGAQAPPSGPNEGGILETFAAVVDGRDVRVPQSDQSVDGINQANLVGDVLIEDVLDVETITGNPVFRATSPNDDLRLVLSALLGTAQQNNIRGMEANARDLLSILLGTTRSRVYDGFPMLNFNRSRDPRIGPEHFPPDVIAGEYKAKWARRTDASARNPFDGAERRVWEVDVNLLFFDEQVVSDTHFVLFPPEAHPDDRLRVSYRILSLVDEFFLPLVLLRDRRPNANTTALPFKGFDAVRIEVRQLQAYRFAVEYPPVGMLEKIYHWGSRVHPPRTQILQPIFTLVNAHTGQIELAPRGRSLVERHRQLTLGTVGAAAPERKMLRLAEGVLDGSLTPIDVIRWMLNEDRGPRGRWSEWTSLVRDHRQLPDEVWASLAEEGLERDDFGPYDLITAFLNNEIYSEGPFFDEVTSWNQGGNLRIKVFNLDNHPHYYQVSGFGPKLNNEFQRCCGGGGLTTVEIINHKPFYGLPKEHELQWRAGWGFRPRFGIVQQLETFLRSSDQHALRPFFSERGELLYGYRFSTAETAPFRFNPPPSAIARGAARLREADGKNGLVLGAVTPGFGGAQVCPRDPFPGECGLNLASRNPYGVVNRDTDGDGRADALIFPSYLRNPQQETVGAGDLILGNAAWEPFLYVHPEHGGLRNDPGDINSGFWVDQTFIHGAPIAAGESFIAELEIGRAAGQRLYQSDGLFQDSANFAPHPTFEVSDRRDSIIGLKATLAADGKLRIAGRATALRDGLRADWVTVHGGPTSADGTTCEGPVLANAPVLPETGRFVVRCRDGKGCRGVSLKGVSLGVGDVLCVRSTMDAVRETVVIAP